MIPTFAISSWITFHDSLIISICSSLRYVATSSSSFASPVGFGAKPNPDIAQPILGEVRPQKCVYNVFLINWSKLAGYNPRSRSCCIAFYFKCICLRVHGPFPWGIVSALCWAHTFRTVGLLIEFITCIIKGEGWHSRQHLLAARCLGKNAHSLHRLIYKKEHRKWYGIKKAGLITDAFQYPKGM